REAAPLGLTVPQRSAYLRDHLHFYLGQRALAALPLFPRKAAGCGLAPDGAAIDPLHASPSAQRLTAASAVQPTLDKAPAGERITFDEGLRLLESHDLTAIGRAADAAARRLHPGPYRIYNIDRNINYTNVCTAVCDFCAFYRPPKHAESYVLP